MKRFLALALLTVLISACGGGGSVPGPDGDQSAADSTSTTGGSGTGDDNSPQDPPEEDPIPDPVSKVDLLSLGSEEFIDQVFVTQNLVEPTQVFLQGSWTVRVFKSVLQGDHYVDQEQAAKQVMFSGDQLMLYPDNDNNQVTIVFDLKPLSLYYSYDFSIDAVLQKEQESVCDSCVLVTRHHIPDGTKLYYDATKPKNNSFGPVGSIVNDDYTFADLKLSFLIEGNGDDKSLSLNASGISYRYCWQADVVSQGETPENVKAELEAICDQQEQMGILDPQPKSISLSKGQIQATLDYSTPTFWVINNGTPVMYFFIKN